jgi:hypothetical protein
MATTLKITKVMGEHLVKALANANREVVGARTNTERAMITHGLVRHEELRHRVTDSRGHLVRSHGLVLTERGEEEALRLRGGQQQAEERPAPSPAPATLPEVPEDMAPRSMADAIAFLGSLKAGDRVRVTREGRTADLVVSRGPRRSDGAFGSPESTQVTVSYGVGRYSYEINAGHLFAQRAGQYTTYGGTRMMRLPAEAPAPETFADNASAVSARFAAVQSGTATKEKGMHEMTEQEHASAFGERFARAQRAASQEPAEGDQLYTIEVTTRVVSTEAESCRFEGEDDHECTGDCTSLDGDVRELETPSTQEITADADDLEAFEGDPVAWAVDYIRTKTDAVEPSSSPIGDTAREHEWLSGTYTDSYDNSKETHTSVRLTGDWTEQQRAQVFTAATRY